MLPWLRVRYQIVYSTASVAWISLPWMLPSMYIAVLDSGGPVSGSLSVTSQMSRPPTDLPSDSICSRFGYARTSARSDCVISS